MDLCLFVVSSCRKIDGYKNSFKIVSLVELLVVHNSQQFVDIIVTGGGTTYICNSTASVTIYHHRMVVYIHNLITLLNPQFQRII